MTDLIEPAEHPRNYDPPGWSNADAINARDATIREQAAEIERLRAALIAACEILQVDRTALFETSGDRATGAIDDPDDQAALDDYDRVIAQADAALGSER